MKNPGKLTYDKPSLVKMSNLREITFDCPNFQCSVLVPPAPPPPGS